MDTIISKELFIEALNDAKKCDEYQDWLNSSLKKNGVDGYIFQPNCVDTVVKLLHTIFSATDADNWISYFCFELGFGSKWKPDMVRDENGNDIDLSNAENLYDFLCSR